jgi:hypothetical protein
MPPTLYSARFDCPDLLQQGRDETVQCRMYRAGAPVAPTEAGSTVTIYDEDGDEVVSAEDVTVADSVATYDVDAAITASLDCSRNWRIAWSLVMPDGVVHLVENRAALVRRVPHPNVTEAALYARCPALDPASPTCISSRTEYSSTIDEAWFAIINRLVESDLRIEDVVNPPSYREVHLCLALSMIFQDLATRLNAAYRDIAADWRAQYEAAWGRLSPEIDTDDDGIADDIGSARGPIWAM